jgi:hypothetical protein
VSTQNGVLINSGGTIVSIVLGWAQSAVAPEGQTFSAVDNVSEFTPGQPALSMFTASVKTALDASDKTMFRISEAVTLGLTTWSTADVVAWVTYRRALRALLGASTVTSLPARPAYPVGT